MILILFGAREDFRRFVYERTHLGDRALARRADKGFDVGLPSGETVLARLVERDDDLRHLSGMRPDLVIEDDSFRALGLRVDTYIVR